MMINSFAEDIPSISKALNSLDEAFITNCTIAVKIQEALAFLKSSLQHETFVDSTATRHSEHFSAEEANLNHSLQHLTNSLVDVHVKLLSLKESVRHASVFAPIYF
jgi:hypothetical protein